MYRDTRLGNTPQWFLDRPKDWAMRVPENVRKCVAFFARLISKGAREERVFGGTGFLVSVPSARIQGCKYNYAVTAKHVAAQMALGDWVMRVNTKDGRFLDIRGTKEHRWWVHPTEEDTVDVAVSPILVPEEADCTAIAESMFLDDATIQRSNIGAGDEVVIAGLFSKIPGLSKNLPIVRTGNIALMPDPGERLPGVSIGGRAVDSEAYLIEARSIGGLSGSPAFVRTSVSIQVPVQRLVEGQPVDDAVRGMWCQLPGSFFFLGSVHGHWDILPEDKNEVDPRNPSQKGKKEAVNLGIAVVVPAKKVREVLYHPELVERRSRDDQGIAEAHGTTTPD
jgi:hypothetical protein